MSPIAAGLADSSAIRSTRAGMCRGNSRHTCSTPTAAVSCGLCLLIHTTCAAGAQGTHIVCQQVCSTEQRDAADGAFRAAGCC
jgi:hypothetical protein